jgi:hypothetical protein
MGFKCSQIKFLNKSLKPYIKTQLNNYLWEEVILKQDEAKLQMVRLEPDENEK